MMDAKAFRARLKQVEEPTVVLTFAPEPGFQFRLRRVPLDVMVAAGIIPDSFYRQIIKASAPDGLNKDIAEVQQQIKLRLVTPEEGEKRIAELRAQWLAEMDGDSLATISLAAPKLILAAVVEPKLVAGQAQSEDEISLLELPDETKEGILGWIFAGCPGLAIRTKGGQISHDDLSRFPEQEQSNKSDQSGIDGEAVSTPALRAVGD